MGDERRVYWRTNLEVPPTTVDELTADHNSLGQILAAMLAGNMGAFAVSAPVSGVEPPATSHSAAVAPQVSLRPTPNSLQKAHSVKSVLSSLHMRRGFARGKRMATNGRNVKSGRKSRTPDPIGGQSGLEGFISTSINRYRVASAQTLGRGSACVGAPVIFSLATANWRECLVLTATKAYCCQTNC